MQFWFIYRYLLRDRLQRIAPKRQTAPSHYKSKEFIQDIQAKHEKLPKESAEWVNIVLAKFYDDFFDSKSFNKWFYTMYVRSIFNFRRTPLGLIIKKADLDSWYTGDNFIRIKNLTVPYHSTDHTSVTLTMDFSFDGNIQGACSIETIFGITFSMKGRMDSLHGTMMYQHDPEFYSYSFLKKPKLKVAVDVYVNRYKCGALSRLATWVTERIWLSKNVLPNTRTRWHKNKPVMPPYPFEVVHDPELVFKWPKPANAKYDPEETDCE